MKYEAKSPEDYITQVPELQQTAFSKLRTAIADNIPEGFEETMIYGMIGYVVPHSIYPNGYHVNPELPLPFINIAAQKNFIALYHMGMYTNQQIHDWFVDQYKKNTNHKLDMGKSCIRLKKYNDIPYDLICNLAGKITPQEWIEDYEKSLNIKK